MPYSINGALNSYNRFFVVNVDSVKGKCSPIDWDTSDAGVSFVSFGFQYRDDAPFGLSVVGFTAKHGFVIRDVDSGELLIPNDVAASPTNNNAATAWDPLSETLTVAGTRNRNNDASVRTFDKFGDMIRDTVSNHGLGMETAGGEFYQGRFWVSYNEAYDSNVVHFGIVDPWSELVYPQGSVGTSGYGGCESTDANVQVVSVCHAHGYAIQDPVCEEMCPSV